MTTTQKKTTEAYNLLVNYKSYGNQNKRNASAVGGLDQVAFLTEAKRTKADGTKGNYYPHIKCDKCGEFGHYKSNCPKKNKQTENKPSEGSETETSLVTMHVALAVVKTDIDPMWILCDNESTVDIFKNRDILSNIRKTSKPIRLKGIEGNAIEVTKEGELLGYGPIYHHSKVAANVLSFYTRYWQTTSLNSYGKILRSTVRKFIKRRARLRGGTPESSDKGKGKRNYTDPTVWIHSKE
jgi:hypothetical protein